MFDDLGQQKYVFRLLDEWASAPNECDLTYDTGSKSKLNIELTKLMGEVEKLESKTIKINPRLKIGFSFQSELLGELWYSLANANSPAKLLANLTNIKILLLQAMIINIDIKHDKLELINAEIKPDAEIGKKRKKQVEDWAKKGGKTLKKYDDKCYQGWLKTANDLRGKNSKISLRSIATHINKNDINKPPIETVRKYIADKLG